MVVEHLTLYTVYPCLLVTLPGHRNITLARAQTLGSHVLATRLCMSKECWIILPPPSPAHPWPPFPSYSCTVQGGVVTLTTVTDERADSSSPSMVLKEDGYVGSVRWDPESAFGCLSRHYIFVFFLIFLFFYFLIYSLLSFLSVSLFLWHFSSP